MDTVSILEKIGRTIYHLPTPPARVRVKPMELLCVGFPRSGTEALQAALMKLGYDYTYHGWDILFEDPPRQEAICRWAHNKWFNSKGDGDFQITAEEFNEVLGHCVAVTDAIGSCFAAELIQAYPEAKVVLNVRQGLQAWQKSVMRNLAGVESNYGFWILSWFNAEFWWGWHVYERVLWPRLFRSPRTSIRAGASSNAIWVHREHCAMVKGMVPADRLLEYRVEGGWDPLCKFLGKEIPRDEFPHANDGAGFNATIEKRRKSWAGKAIRNLIITLSVLLGVVLGILYSCHLLDG